MTTFDGKKVKYAYDSVGRLVSQTDPNDLDSTGAARAFKFAYDDVNRTNTVTFPSGVSQKVSFDVEGNTTKVELLSSNQAALQSFSYDYGSAADGSYWNGYALSVTEVDGSVVSYSYDDLGRLTRTVRTGGAPYTQSYAYDANDNRTSITKDGTTTTASYDAANQMTASGGSSYSYDRAGNMTSDGSSSYSYDASNKMVGASIVKSGSSTSIAYGYDGDGRRSYQTVGTSRSDYWYDVTGLSRETGDGNTTYLRGQGGELLSRTRGIYVADYATDRLGNVTGLTGPDGAWYGEYTYDPYGQETGNTATGWYNPFRYTSTYLDSSSGMYQMGARYYMPGAGRFSQTDSMGISVFARQRYAHVGCNPSNDRDPSGMLSSYCVWSLARFGVLAVSTAAFVAGFLRFTGIGGTLLWLAAYFANIALSIGVFMSAIQQNRNIAYTLS